MDNVSNENIISKKIVSTNKGKKKIKFSQNDVRQ